MLRDVVRIAQAEAVTMFVIGAGARLLVHDWPRNVPGGRTTTDWDVAVRVASWSVYQKLRAALTQEGAPFEATSVDHRLRHESGRMLDLVPFGGVETRDRKVTYPDGRTTHSVLGLSECEACCVEVDVGEGLRVRAVGPPALVILKAGTYLERRPAKTHDLLDLDFIVRTYGDALGDELVFDRASDLLHEGRVAYCDVGAYLLAQDIRALSMPAQAERALHDVIAELVDVQSRAVGDLVPRGHGEEARLRDEIVARYGAFRLGIEP